MIDMKVLKMTRSHVTLKILLFSKENFGILIPRIVKAYQKKLVRLKVTHTKGSEDIIKKYP